MPGYGTGYDSWWACPGYKRLNWRTRTEADHQLHQVTLTGKVRWPLHDGKGHPRKSWLAFQWVCRCGRTGWSQHKDLENRALREGVVAADDVRLTRSRRHGEAAA